eukprot:3941442-Rhodomonas_salina.2
MSSSLWLCDVISPALSALIPRRSLFTNDLLPCPATGAEEGLAAGDVLSTGLQLFVPRSICRRRLSRRPCVCPSSHDHFVVVVLRDLMRCVLGCQRARILKEC